MSDQCEVNLMVEYCYRGERVRGVPAKHRGRCKRYQYHQGTDKGEYRPTWDQ